VINRLTKIFGPPGIGTQGRMSQPCCTANGGIRALAGQARRESNVSCIPPHVGLPDMSARFEVGNRTPTRRLSAGKSAPDDEGFCAGCNGFGKRLVGRVVGKVLLAGKVSQERATLFGHMVSDGAAQHRVTGLNGVHNGSGGDRAVDLHGNLVLREMKCADRNSCLDR